MSVREIQCSTLLHSLAYKGSTGYTANLYKGCSHGCVYCYAPSLNHDERRWGSYVDVKVNAPSVMEKELKKLRKDEVFLSSASDPYQPIEARYGLTRNCLGVLVRHKFPVSILTRSSLVLRDLEIIKRLEWARVGMSITTVPVRRFEPGVPPLRRRIDTLRKLAEAGVETYVSLAPVIPGNIMVDLDELFDELRAAGVSCVWFAILSFKGYEASRRLFEEVSETSVESALEGTEELVKRLSKLVRDYGMKPGTGTFHWKPPVPPTHPSISLDSF